MRPAMDRLSQQTGETVNLAVPDGPDVLNVAEVPSRYILNCSGGWIGRRTRPHAVANGKVLLAYGSDDLLAAVLASGLTRYTAHTIVVPGHLRRALARVRRDGIAFGKEEMSVGSVSVASPLLAAEGCAVAALDVVVRADRSDLRRLAPAVHATANSVSRILQQAGA